MKKKGQLKYIPSDVLEELEITKKSYDITKDDEAFRMMKRNSIRGRKRNADLTDEWGLY